MYAPSKLGEQPSIEVSKEYILKPNKIHLEASLDKEVGIAANRLHHFVFCLMVCTFLFVHSFIIMVRASR